MLLSLPIYVEVRREEGQLVHRCRPAFVDGVQAADPHLGLAMSKLGKRLKQHFAALASAPRHDALAQAAFAPNLETHVLKLTLELRARTVKCKLLFVVFPALSRQIAFSPALPELWFEVRPGESLATRATEVLTRHFRAIEKDERDDSASRRAESLSLEGQAWVATIDVQASLHQTTKKSMQRQLAALFDDTKLDGGAELARVGRCLDWLYPDELLRAVARDHEAEQLDRLLQHPDNRPVAVVGPRLVGKTTVLHECVRRRVARRGKPYAARHNVWLIAPQRLISGMMYVGQWEGRVQAILREARRRRHVLAFDDFLGLYHAGISRDASLSVAEVLKPFIYRREVRVLAELTPEAWQALQERDRGLADQFHVLRIAPTSEEETRRVMLEVHRQLEAEHRCVFDLTALPMIVQLFQSYIRDAAFPGKSAAFSRQLARKHAGGPIGPEQVQLEFHTQTGLSLALLDDRKKLQRDEVVRSLQSKLVGQDEAVQAAANLVAIAKARLADPARPLATLLFLGPTGVGKTQCAKALAEVMFGNDSARLLRFDMNEFVTPHAAARLVGVLGEPDGLLTSAVRRQPFSIVLLDEIEKAHPNVFDLLLQVTGEGRLTDALGRTADFSNTVIVMTSNLGTTAGQRQIGLASSTPSGKQVYVRAAENFFRPEFFNRLDRIVPFGALSRDEMTRIAELLLNDVFQRDGLVRRRCAVAVTPEALERIVDRGYDPHFGARALKRAIEQQLVHPVAASLAGVKPELPAVVGVYPHSDGVTACVQPLASVVQVEHGIFAELPPQEQLARVEQFTARMAREIDTLRPATAAGRGISPQQLRYYTLREQLYRIRELAATLGRSVESAQRETHRLQISPKAPRSERIVQRNVSRSRPVPTQRFLRDIQAAQDIHDYLRETAANEPHAKALPERLAELGREAALLHSLHESAGTSDRALVVVRPLVTCETPLYDSLVKLFQHLDYGCEAYTRIDPRGPRLGLLVTGPGIWPLTMAEAGVHLFCRQHENLLPVQVSVFVADQRTLAEQIETQLGHREQWLKQLATGQALVADDPLPLGPIVRIYDESGPTLDLRSGLSLSAYPTPADWKRLVLAGLSLPPELEV